MSWWSWLLILLLASLSGFAAAGFAFVSLWPRLMQRLPATRLHQLEVRMTELESSFTSLLESWKRFRSAEGMRELRAARRQPKTAATSELTGAAWKHAKRAELGGALLNPKEAFKLHGHETDSD